MKKFALKYVAISLLFGLASQSSFAVTDGERQASTFAGIYSNTCLKHLDDFNNLRVKLKKLKQMAPEKAAAFLANQPGDAWLIKERGDTYVVAIMKDLPQCAVFAKTADTKATRTVFNRMLSTAPNPMTIKKVKDEPIQNNTTHLISYELMAPNAPQAMILSLTSPMVESGQMMATAVLVNKK